mmetsp:Transcript_21254/g.66611  ORF Transcript_21254/g.66611 Transcript_21254/m.66611 type:complete len:272 (-) Transcript_21254:357-1172(-)
MGPRRWSRYHTYLLRYSASATSSRGRSATSSVHRPLEGPGSRCQGIQPTWVRLHRTPSTAQSGASRPAAWPRQRPSPLLVEIGASLQRGRSRRGMRSSAARSSRRRPVSWPCARGPWPCAGTCSASRAAGRRFCRWVSGRCTGRRTSPNGPTPRWRPQRPGARRLDSWCCGPPDAWPSARSLRCVCQPTTWAGASSLRLAEPARSPCGLLRTRCRWESAPAPARSTRASRRFTASGSSRRGPLRGMRLWSCVHCCSSTVTHWVPTPSATTA